MSLFASLAKEVGSEVHVQVQENTTAGTHVRQGYAVSG